MNESAFQTKVLEYLKTKGGHWIKIHASSHQSAGEPDIVGCYKGLFVAFELKNPDGTGRLSKLQEVKINHIKSNAGIAIVASDMRTIQETLRKIDGSYANIIAEIQEFQLVD